MSESKSKSHISDRLWVGGRRLFYRWLRLTSRMIGTLLFSFRSEGRHHLDIEGGAMILSTHQSMLDPVLVGLVSNRRMNYLARKTLFKNRLFGFLIRVLDAIEIDRERGGLSGLKEMLKRLKAGEFVLIFPEGTRTMDGCVGELKPGFIPIARRSEVPLIPVAIVGAYGCLPRGAKLPSRKPISVIIGEPMLANTYNGMTDEQLIAELSQRLHHLHARGKALSHGT